MSYLSQPFQSGLTKPVTLLPPSVKSWLITYRIFYGVLIGPLLLIGQSLYYWLGLNLLQFACAMAATLILLLNVYFYLLRKRKDEIGFSIWIDLDEIQLLKKGTVLYKDSLKNLCVTQLDPGAGPTNTPTNIWIEGKNFPRINIRSKQYKKTVRSMEKTDFCVASEKEWKRLVNALAGAQETN